MFKFNNQQCIPVGYRAGRDGEVRELTAIGEFQSSTTVLRVSTVSWSEMNNQAFVLLFSITIRRATCPAAIDIREYLAYAVHSLNDK